MRVIWWNFGFDGIWEKLDGGDVLERLGMDGVVDGLEMERLGGFGYWEEEFGFLYQLDYI